MVKYCSLCQSYRHWSDMASCSGTTRGQVPADVTLHGIYATTSRCYQAVTGCCQLSPPMIDVAVSSEVTDRSLSKVSFEKSRLSAALAATTAPQFVRSTHPWATLSRKKRQRQPVDRTYSNQPLPVGQSKFDISPAYLCRPKPAAYALSLAYVVCKWSVRAPSLDWTSNYWCGIDFLLSCGRLSTPAPKTRCPPASRAGVLRQR